MRNGSHLVEPKTPKVALGLSTYEAHSPQASNKLHIAQNETNFPILVHLQVICLGVSAHDVQPE